MAHPLMSIGKLCDSGCTATFDKENVFITKNNKTIMKGNRSKTTNLWTLPLSSRNSSANNVADSTPDDDFVEVTLNSANSAYHQRTKDELVEFLHATSGYPVISTWSKAIKKNNFATWPGLTYELAQKLDQTIPTIKGHLHNNKKNIRSTKKSEDLDDLVGTEPEEKTNLVYFAVADITGEISTDLTGRFPVTSSRGMKYILIMYDYDSNAILAEPMKSRYADEHTRAFNVLYKKLCDAGLKPKFVKLDNEASAEYKQNMKSKGLEFQLVPPDDHRRNPAERAIQTFKNHLISILAGTDKDFPLHLWCRLLPQATTTLNLLRQSRINPKLSAEAQLNGAFDFNKTPMAPLGTKVVIHEKASKRKTWDPHGADGWYIGHSPEHYRCYRVYVSKTASERTGNVVVFFPAHVKMPATSSADAAVIAAKELTHALLNPAPAAPFLDIGDKQLEALKQLAEIFQTGIKNSSEPPPTNGAKPPRVPQTDATSPRVHSHFISDPTEPPIKRYPIRDRKPVTHYTNVAFAHN